MAPLLAVERRVADPEIHHRLLAGGPDLQFLVRVDGPDGHQVLVVTLAGRAALAQDRGFAEWLLPALAGKGVIHLQPVIALAHAAETGAYLAHLPAVQELMVHVHQVLVHEAIMAGHFTAEPPGAVGGILCLSPKRGT